MALYNKVDFCALCGINHAYLITYVKRGKIIERTIGDGKFYDDTNKVNLAFIKGRKKEAAPTVNVPVDEDEEDIIPKMPGRNDSTSKKTIDQHDLGIVKTKVQIKKINEDYEKVKIQNAKLRGEVIPSELIKPFLIQNNQSILNEFKNAVDEVIRIFAHKRDLTVAEIADVKGQIIPVINIAVSKATEVTLTQVKNMINDYSETKGGG